MYSRHTGRLSGPVTCVQPGGTGANVGHRQWSPLGLVSTRNWPSSSSNGLLIVLSFVGRADVAAGGLQDVAEQRREQAHRIGSQHLLVFAVELVAGQCAIA